LVKLGIIIEEQQIELVKIRSFIDTEQFGSEQMVGKLIYSDWLIHDKTTLTDLVEKVDRQTVTG
ncbi:Hypothetical predicted protein, partial [Mytilus galloprovincialis]